MLTVLAAIGGCSSAPAKALHPWSAASVPPSAAPQLAGKQLTAALLPGRDFPSGYKIDTKASSDSGTTVQSPNSQQQLSGMTCKNFQLSYEGPGFGETAFAERIIDSADTTAFFNQTIYQFKSASAAAAFFSGVRGVAGTCRSFTFTSTSNDSPTHEQLRLSTAPRGIPGQAYTIQETRRVVLNGITVNSTAVNLVAMEGTDVYELTTFSADGAPPQTPSLTSMVERLMTRVSSSLSAGIAHLAARMTGSLPLADARAKSKRAAYARPVLPAQRVCATIAALAALVIAGCGSSGSPSADGTDAGAATRAPGTLTAPATSPARTDVPEPATAPPLTRTPAGTVVPVPGSPEGLAVDAKDGILAVGIRQPDGIALVNAGTGQVRGVVRLPGAPRHLQLAGPQGPVLVPAEQVGRLFQVAIPGGTLIADTKVGRQPHDAAAAGGTVFVGNEYSNTVSLVRNGRQVAVESAPQQPGGVAAALDGSVVVVVGVRGRRIEAYTPGGRPLGSAPCGVGPTHVRAGPHKLFYVADTEGNQVLTFAVTANGPRQVGAAPTRGGAPYGIAVDPVRGLVYVTLTATNTLEAFRIEGQALVPDGQWPTVRQPNDVAVDTATGRVYVAGRDENQLEMLAGP